MPALVHEGDDEEVAVTQSIEDAPGVGGDLPQLGLPQFRDHTPRRGAVASESARR